MLSYALPLLVRATPERPATVRILASLPKRYVVAGTKSGTLESSLVVPKDQKLENVNL